ncbi:MAG: NfeD family protein [Planctomycetota bacterium]
MITLAIIVYLAGLALIALEMLVPGGVVGTIGFLCCIGAIVIAWHEHWAYGLVGLVFVLLATPLMIYFGIRRLSLRKSLVKGDAAEGSRADLDELIEQEGVAKSVLRPAGIATFGTRRVNVVTRGDMIEADAKVKVIAVEGNRVVVKKIE